MNHRLVGSDVGAEQRDRRKNELISVASSKSNDRLEVSNPGAQVFVSALCKSRNPFLAVSSIQRSLGTVRKYRGGGWHRRNQDIPSEGALPSGGAIWERGVTI